MAGHSKFKNIMHRKGAQDAKRAKIFARLSREIAIAARSSDDPTKNPHLRAVLADARSHNMPKDKIQNAIKKASSGNAGDDLESIRYEGFGPGGSAIIVEALTDNKNRTACDVRTAFGKNGGQLGETGSVSYLFEHIGYVVYKKDSENFDQAMDIALNHNAQDILEEDDHFQIIVPLEHYAALRNECLEKLGDFEMANIAWFPINTIDVSGEKAETLQKLIATLEDLDDVQNVFTNSAT